MTTASPSLSFAHGPPRLCHSALVGTGPSTTLWLTLSNTARPVLTTCTYWVAPTAPTVSGGAYCTLKLPLGPVKPTPRPGKLLPSVGAFAPVVPDCNAPSACLPLPSMKGIGCAG